MDNTTFSEGILKLLHRLNCVSVNATQERGCQPFFVDNKQVGLIRSDFWIYLKTFTDVFICVSANSNCDNDSHEKNSKCGVHLNPNLQTYQQRSDAVNTVLENLRGKDVIPALRGWRHENYSVCQKYADKALLEVERAGSGLFGFIQYGVHVNGYTKDENGKVFVWVGRRSKTKPTFPDMYDNMVAGGLPAGMGILECVKKECEEEASLSGKVLDGLQFTGTVSYFYEDGRGMFPECQHIFDLLLPDDFTPKNADGEVGSFQKVSITELKELMIGDNFKPNCVAVCLDFLLRHGFINPDSDPYCSYYVEQMHVSLQSYYAGR